MFETPLRTFTAGALACLASYTHATKVTELQIPDASAEGNTLQVFRFSPDNPEGPLPGIVMFHGGSWRKGGPSQLKAFCKEFSDAGFVAYTSEYRLIGKNTDTVADCVADAEVVTQWLLDHAKEQGIDPDKFFIGGASAGGHVSLCVFLTPDDNGASRFVGYIGYNPVVTSKLERFDSTFSGLGDEYDPMTLLSASSAPMLIFHGDADPVVPIESVRALQSKAEELGVPCNIVVFEGKTHGFFNAGKAEPEVRKKLKTEGIEFLEANSQ